MTQFCSDHMEKISFLALKNGVLQQKTCSVQYCYFAPSINCNFNENKMVGGGQKYKEYTKDILSKIVI